MEILFIGFCICLMAAYLYLARLLNNWRGFYLQLSKSRITFSEAWLQLGNELEAEENRKKASDYKKHSWLLGALSLSYVLLALVMLLVAIVFIIA